MADFEERHGQDDRRSFLKKAGTFAAITPPVVTFLLSTSMSSKAIAASGGSAGTSGAGDSSSGPPSAPPGGPGPGPGDPGGAPKGRSDRHVRHPDPRPHDFDRHDRDRRGGKITMPPVI